VHLSELILTVRFREGVQNALLLKYAGCKGNGFACKMQKLIKECREKAFSCRIKKTKIRKASKYWKNNFQAKQKCHDENA